MNIHYDRKYLKYKSKYMNLKNMYGGSEISNQKYIDISEKFKNILSKTDLLAYILHTIMTDLDITNTEYMIIASYCLHDFREIGDLDVIILTEAYNKLKEHNIGELSVAKISGDERIVFRFQNIDNDAEIEFFPKDKNIGFPTNDFSIENLQQNHSLEYDKYGNPYYDINTCVKQYSAVNKINDKYYMGIYETNIDRIKKNISHLETIKDFLNKYRDLNETIDLEIDKLRNMTIH